MVFISHDIQTVRQVSDRIVVMYGGQILETGSTEDIFNHPTVDYTRKLLGSWTIIVIKQVNKHLNL